MSDAGQNPATDPGLLTVPGWERFPWLRAAFSTRQGGRSSAYGPGDQNLGWTAEDAPASVAEARQIFLTRVAGTPQVTLTTAHQVHGDRILDLRRAPFPRVSAEGRALLQADGLVAAEPGQFIGVITADCVPVFLLDPHRRVVSALHAGWRGTLAGIVRRGVELLCDRYGSQPEDLLAAIGPSVGACCFAVGPEVAAAFAQQHPSIEGLFEQRTSGPAPAQTFLNLWEANRRMLQLAGVPDRAVTTLAECTACTRLPDGRRRFFSHRAEQGRTGRMLNILGILPGGAL